ncbi:MAG: lactate utilization protein [Cytophagales bacterium]|nr:lactate utilization protein [Cytophagales bacterium]MDW8384450.1 LUD domain-containing protein [Flammeovirgaceae bacterium]
MKSREQILQAVKRNKPAFSPLPEIPFFESPLEDLASIFAKTLTKIGGEAFFTTSQQEAFQLLRQWTTDYPNVVSTVSWAMLGNIKISNIEQPHQLEQLDLAILEGQLGVAENAAIWITEEDAFHRAVPFIAQHLILVLHRHKIVWNMHEAYSKILINSTGYGVFIAGPSKTADIEQSLVVGAHGPRSLRVLIYESSS